MAFTCRYAASGKNADRPKPGLPVVTASHRSAIALRKAAEFVRGRAWVCGQAPAPGATGTAAVGEACGAALRVGVAVRPSVAGDDDTADDPVALALAVIAGDGGAGGLPHPVSKTP